MLTALQLRQFKSWQDTGAVALAPVTMLLGTNSSGKSSLIQSLLLLKQTARSPDRTVHLDLVGEEGTASFHFGDFASLLKQGASPRRVGIGFSFARRGSTERVASGRFQASYGQSASGAVVVQELTLEDGDGQRFRAVRREKGSYGLLLGAANQSQGKSPAFCPERSIALPAQAIAQLGAAGARAEDLSLAIRRELEEILYLGPLRRRPERDYQWDRARPGEIGSDGGRCIDILLADALLPGPERHAIVNGVSHWLQRMGIAQQLLVRPLGRSGRYELVVDQEAVAANLHDVGIGLSQVLPVLTVAFFAPPGSTVILEEPEIHLHPLAQSVLAELLVEVSQSRRVQFIVETHSEHLFRRMQTLVARQAIAPADCALYFVDKRAGSSQLRRLSLDDYGRLLDWPEHFFGNAMGDAEEQARLMFERQMLERQMAERQRTGRQHPERPAARP